MLVLRRRLLLLPMLRWQQVLVQLVLLVLPGLLVLLLLQLQVLLMLLLPVLLRALLLQHLLLRLLLMPLLGRMLVLVLVYVRAQAGQRDCAQCSYWGWRRGYRASQPRARFLATARQRQRGATDDAIDGR